MASDSKPATRETRPAQRYDVGERGGYSPTKVVSLNEVPAPSNSPAPGTPIPAPVSAAPAAPAGNGTD